jgi:hypothetical protein
MTTAVDTRGVDALCDTTPVGVYPYTDLQIFDSLVADFGPLPVYGQDLSFEAWCGSAPWPTTVSLDELLPTLVGKVADAKHMDVGQLLTQMSTQITVEAALKQQAAAELKLVAVPTGRKRGGGKKGQQK